MENGEIITKLTELYGIQRRNKKQMDNYMVKYNNDPIKMSKAFLKYYKTEIGNTTETIKLIDKSYDLVRDEHKGKLLEIKKGMEDYIDSMKKKIENIDKMLKLLGI